MLCNKHSQRGFTLIEVLIVVVIISIIAAVALPSYFSSVIKSKRSIGKAELMEVIARQEQFFVNNKAYATTLTALGYGTNPYHIDDQGGETASANSIYQIALSGASTTAFTIQAIPKNAQADDTDCATLQLSSTGVQSISGGSSTAAECW